MFTLKRITTITFALAMTAVIFGCRGSQSPAQSEGSIQFGAGEVVESQLSDNKDDAPDDSSSTDTSTDKFFAIKNISAENKQEYSSIIGGTMTKSSNGTTTYSYDADGRLSRSVVHSLISETQLRDDMESSVSREADITTNISWSDKRPTQVGVTLNEKLRMVRDDGTEQELSKTSTITVDLEYMADGRLLKIITTKQTPGSEDRITVTNYSYNGNIRSQEEVVLESGGQWAAFGSGTTTLEYGENNLVKEQSVCYEPSGGAPYCNTDQYTYNSDNKLTSIETTNPQRLIPLGGEVIVGEVLTVIRDSTSGRAIDYTTRVKKYIDTLLTTEDGRKPLTTLNEDSLPVMEVDEVEVVNDEGDTKSAKTTKRYTYTELGKKPTMLPTEEHKALRNYLTPSMLLIFDNPESLYLPLK